MCLQTCHAVAREASYVLVSCGGLYHCYQTRVESDLCKKPNAMATPLKDVARMKGLTSSSSPYLHSQPYKRLRDLGVNVNSYPVSTILSHSVRSPVCRSEGGVARQ